MNNSAHGSERPVARRGNIESPRCGCLLLAMCILVACSDGVNKSPEVMYPKPHFLSLEGSDTGVSMACVDFSAVGDRTTPKDILTDLGNEAGLLVRPQLAANCNWTLRISPTVPPIDESAASVWLSLSGNPDRFVIAPEGNRADLLLYSESELGLVFALRRAFSLLVHQNGGYYGRRATLVDAPSFGHRGVVEGFYGPPYSEAQRSTLMAQMGRLLMDTYVYGPKGDPYSFGLWAEPYPAAEAQAIGAAARYAKRHGLAFVWALAPAWPPEQTSVRFGSAEDLAKVMAKLDSVHSLGVQRFAIFLDDINDRLIWPEDRARFASVAEAHAHFLNQVQRELRTRNPLARLLMVGTHYSKSLPGWEQYLRVMGAQLSPEIDVFWTGNKVYSTTITGDDLAAANLLLGRKVVIWDNAPERLQPIAGRSAELAEHVSGYLFNPVMNEWRVNTFEQYLQVLGPQADYLWNSTSYDSETSMVTWSSLR